jgi:paraquat-inducible protein B
VAGLVAIGSGRLFQERQHFVAYFGESIKGLAIGAPVTFQGVRVGSVTDIRVVVYREAQQIRSPVFFEISAGRIGEADGREFRFSRDGSDAKLLFDRGLRAQLQLQSLVTGQLGINLDFHPGAPLVFSGEPGDGQEFPTIPSTMAELGQSLNDLDVNELAQDIRRTVKAAAELVSSPEVKLTLRSAHEVLVRVNTLVGNADARIATLGAALEKSSAEFNETLGAMRTLARHIDDQTVPDVGDTLQAVRHLARRIDAETVPAANLLLGDARRVVDRVGDETIPAANQFLTQVRHLAEQFETTSEAAKLAVEQVRKLALNVDTAVQDRHPLLLQVNTTLQELSNAARSFRILADYLERHPETLLFGKGGK